ncbi:MAG: GFA family protein [Pleurocapsa sp. MO_226.B13]|nr:GFA family protein [Pleurocapsa sp. MO_226.B13]
MSDTIKGKGSCLCGAVHVNAKNLSKHVGACHCSMCRKWGGGPLLAVDCGQDVSFEGGENISVYDSSDWGERGFCKKCGSHLFYRLKENQQYIIPAGLFEDQEFFVFDNQVFIDRKPSFYSFANKTTNMTEAEVYEMYSSS